MVPYDYRIVFTVNFGLETKKCIIYPRSDSSNKSTRFSLSSEKSYPNGSGMTPGQLGCVTKEVVMNDDVEKRVLLNKDGSLSVEMKVRFRLVNDETLQWSTEIKKLPTSTNEGSSLQEGDPHCFHGKVEYSEPDSNAECEDEEACSPSNQQMDFIESYCQNCCNHSQGYDIWKNPLHQDNDTSGTTSSCNSAGLSDKIMHQKASVDSEYTVSRSSEEYAEHVLQKASCVQQTITDGDTRIGYCSISRCCSRSEVTTSTTKCNIPTGTCESDPGKICHHNDKTKRNSEFDHFCKVTKVAEHLISSTSNSSIIQSFKKDEEYDYDDLSPSASRATQWCSAQDKEFTCVHCYGNKHSHDSHSSSILPNVSSCSAGAVKSKMHNSMYTAPELPQEGHADTESVDSARSSVSKVSSRSQCCCSQCREAATSLMESHIKSGLKEKDQNSMSGDSKMSNKSQARTNSPRTALSDSGAHKASKKETKSGNSSVSTTSTNTCFSVKSTVCPCCGGCGRLIPANIHDRPDQEAEEDGETVPAQNDIPEVEVMQACSQNALSGLSNCSGGSKQSNNKSNQSACGISVTEIISENVGVKNVEERTKSVVSSAKPNSDIPDKLTTFGKEKKITEETGNVYVDQENTTEAENIMQESFINSKERTGAISSKTHASKHSEKSHKLKNIQDTRTTSPSVSTSPVTDTQHAEMHSGRLTMTLGRSAKVSTKSNASSERDLESVLNLTVTPAGQETKQTTDDAKCSGENFLPVASPSPKSPIMVENHYQSLSVKSAHSKASSKSIRSNKHHCSSSRCVQNLANSPSRKPKSPDSRGLLDEPLSPTSTASVSLGLGAEDRSEDLNERSINIMSQISESSKLDPTINNSAVSKSTESITTAVSISSSVSDKSKLSNFMQDSCKNSDAISGAESESILSTKSKTESKVDVQTLQEHGDQRVTSALSASSETPEQNSRSKNTSAMRKYKHVTQAISKHPDGDETTKASTISSKYSQNKIPCTTKINERSPSNLELKETKKTDSNSVTSVISLKTSKSDKKPAPRNKCATKSEISQNCLTPDSRSDSVLLSNPEQLKEKYTDCMYILAKPDSIGSISNTLGKNCVPEEKQHIDSNCKNSSSLIQRRIRTSSQSKSEDHVEELLMPSCLPNASPTDVINDWLKNIPADGAMYEMEDEFSEQHDETLLHIPAVKDEGCFPNEIGEQFEKPMRVKESQEICESEGADPVTEDKNNTCDAKLACNETFHTTAANSDGSHLSPMFSKRGSLTNNCQSSIQVMKVLLSPKLDRCNSLPEVSPTYGRKLSTSAKGLLDCLANLQLIDPDPKIYDKYSEIISTLQSLWINRPLEAVQDTHQVKLNSAEDEFNPRSSSGVDLSSGSIGSGKGSISGGLEKSETAQSRTTLIAENINTSLVSSDPITPDIAERVRCSPEHEKRNEKAEKRKGLKASDDILNTNEVIKDMKETDSAFATRTSENNEKVAEKDTKPAENNHSKTPPSDQKGQLTKKISQDPDPVWILSLLKKLEKQFMSHYVNAIAEFKVRWDLNDSETIDIMISELKEEVQKRIQSTINRELQKIQSRAGRTPRPPVSMLSRDSLVQTEQRRRRLKVMQNKLNKPSGSEEVNTASGTEVSDQRSEDEYCPCDTCVKRKMASRFVQCAEALRVAPVLKDFDLRKLLQAKKDPAVTPPVQSKLDEQGEQIGGTNICNIQEKSSLEVVNEEACENQENDLGVIHRGRGRVKEKTSADEDDGESRTDRNRHEVGENLEDSVQEVMNREDEVAEDGTEGDTADDEGAMEKDPPSEISAVESNESEEQKRNPVEEKESNYDKLEEEKEVSEGETNKGSETENAEEEERDMVEEQAEIPEESEDREYRTGEETQTAKEGKTSWDESGEAENSNATSDERTPGDMPAAAAEPKPRKNKRAEIIEEENTEEAYTTRKSEAKMSTERGADENQSQSTEAENEVEKKSHESKGKVYIQKTTKMEDSISVQLASEEEDGDQEDVDDMRAESTENQAEGPYHPSRTCGEDSDCKLITQITKASIESQTGSLEYSQGVTVKGKLWDIQSFMESLNGEDS